VPLLVEQEQPRRPHARHPTHGPGVVDLAVGEVLERLVGEQDVEEVEGGLGVAGADRVDEAVHPVDLVELEAAEVGLGAGGVGRGLAEGRVLAHAGRIDLAVPG
jgi:hypothetical protein